MMHQHWYTYIFMILFALALIGFYVSTDRKLIYNMIYTGGLMILWATLVGWNWV